MVPLENVWRAGLKLQFPPDILRMELEAFAAARTLLVNGACSEPVSSLSALVAGASFATDCLFLVLVEPLDQILIEHPRNSLCEVHAAFYADDINMIVSGPAVEAEAEAASVADTVIDKLENILRFKLSRSTKRWGPECQVSHGCFEPRGT